MVFIRPRAAKKGIYCVRDKINNCMYLYIVVGARSRNFRWQRSIYAYCVNACMLLIMYWKQLTAPRIPYVRLLVCPLNMHRKRLNYT